MAWSDGMNPYLGRRRGQIFKAHECVSAQRRAQCIPHGPFTLHSTVRLQMNALLSDHHHHQQQHHHDCSLHPYASLSASYFCQTLLLRFWVRQFIIQCRFAEQIHALAKRTDALILKCGNSKSGSMLIAAIVVHFMPVRYLFSAHIKAFPLHQQPRASQKVFFLLQNILTKGCLIFYKNQCMVAPQNLTQ